ncbi:hypothetical protein NC652_031615 [Populus alba x Populus x berolinensis]|nr:hypothetical protein NC652_031615 [Populus alba x Populus x berolinensis]
MAHEGDDQPHPPQASPEMWQVHSFSSCLFFSCSKSVGLLYCLTVNLDMSPPCV